MATQKFMGKNQLIDRLSAQVGSKSAALTILKKRGQLKPAKIEKELPKKSKVISKHNIIVDSRQRNYNIYPDPSNYVINIQENYKFRR
jgi:hypothetical protein